MASESTPEDGGEPTSHGESVGAYARRLSSCTQVPSERLDELLGWSEQQIREEAQAVTRLLKRFAEAVMRSLDEPPRLHRFVLDLDLKLISRDHDWRAIFAALRDDNATDAEARKRTALVKYLQYLSFRKRLLDYVGTRKASLAETSEMSWARPATTSGARPVLADGHGGAALARLPIGERVAVELGAEQVLELVLGRNVFELVGGESPYLVDENRVTCFLRPGQNVIGRHSECDLPVDGNFKNVSRAHLVLDWDGGEGFCLVDLSTRGTWMREDLLRAGLRPATPVD
jgi:hypothetical protein